MLVKMDDDTLARTRHVQGDDQPDVMQAVADPMTDSETEPEQDEDEDEDDWEDEEPEEEDDWDRGLRPEGMPH